MISVNFERRDFSGPLALSGYQWTVEHLRWKALGGCHTARLRVTASAGLPGLWRLADLLRCPLTVHGPSGPAWWGYLSAVEVHAGGRAARASLDDMVNRAAVVYAEPRPEPWTSERLLTPFAQDAASAALYGVKEGVIPGGRVSPEQALAYRAAVLAQRASPRFGLRNAAAPEPGGAYAVVEARGWWHTLFWRSFSDPRGREGNLRGGLSQVFGDQAARFGVGQSFTVAEAWATKEIWVKLAAAAPGDYLTLSLCASSGGAPGAILAQGVLAGALLGYELEWTRFTLNNEIALQPGQVYWFVLTRSGPVHPTNCYRAAVDEQYPYPGGAAVIYNGSAWVARSPAADLCFLVTGREQTTAHLQRMLAAGAGGQFLAGARIETASGVYGPTYRDGSTTAGEEIERLLAAGKNGGARLLAAVDPRRVLRVFEQPAQSAARVLLDAAGRLCGLDGQPLALGQQPAGQWARLLALSPAGARIAAQESAWIEAAAWDGSRYVIEDSAGG